MTPNRVTHSPIRYVFVCAGCGCLAEGRADQTTCSGACRVRWHRDTDGRQRVAVLMEMLDVTHAGMQQAAALELLCPGLAEAVWAGRIGIDDVRADIAAALDRLAMAHARRLSINPREESTT